MSDLEHRTSLIQNSGGGPKWLGARCTCGWKAGGPGERRDSLERAMRRHTAETARQAGTP